MNSTNSSGVLLQTMIFLMNQSLIQHESQSYNYYLLQIGQESHAEKCYGLYGCFKLSPPWTSEHRPVSLFPEDLMKIEPKFPLYTRQNYHKPVFLDLNDIYFVESSGMDPKKPIYVISHGYVEGGDAPWIIEMAHKLLDREDCSVITVDWRGGSGPPYSQAVANIRLVGAVAAHLLSDIAKHTGTLGLDHVHLIGHSLGAHLSGYVGYALQEEHNLTLSRITGLDPAEPHFAKTQAPVRLDKSAAKYVDIIHTDASQFIRGGLGIVESIGHVDFYPNGGTEQPGCGKSIVQYINDESGSFVKGLKKYLGCNHLRSHEYFYASIDGKCSFKGVPCSSYKDFVNGKCFDCGKKGERCLRMGFHGRKSYEKLKTKPNKGSMVQYLMTADKRPYCMGHYLVKVNVSDSEDSRQHGGEIGQLYFTMHETSDGKGPRSSPAGFISGYYGPGDKLQKVIVADEVNNMKAIEVVWKYNSSLFNPLTWRILSNPKIYIDAIEIEALEIRKRIKVCPKNKKPLVNGQPQLLISSYC
ncbi:pancreatic triacylglycerol lipase [Aethina tumida]|uniref:pancreatic triacylglycerol lipase n=1 Tax=Aethina tumida TaxID=116153 RepID=UPI002148726F|nr:pancreatic triacylglycerol lipase [Aethina tumida]